MVGTRIIEVDGPFYETETEKSHIEVQVSLRIARNRSHMMKSVNCYRHSHHIVSKWIQSAKAFGRREFSFCTSDQMRTNAAIALNAASIAPNTKITIKACT